MATQALRRAAARRITARRIAASCICLGMVATVFVVLIVSARAAGPDVARQLLGRHVLDSLGRAIKTPAATQHPYRDPALLSRRAIIERLDQQAVLSQQAALARPVRHTPPALATHTVSESAHPLRGSTHETKPLPLPVVTVAATQPTAEPPRLAPPLLPPRPLPTTSSTADEPAMAFASDSDSPPMVQASASNSPAAMPVVHQEPLPLPAAGNRPAQLPGAASHASGWNRAAALNANPLRSTGAPSSSGEGVAAQGNPLRK